jgi:hypothetical protein
MSRIGINDRNWTRHTGALREVVWLFKHLRQKSAGKRSAKRSPSRI